MARKKARKKKAELETKLKVQDNSKIIVRILAAFFIVISLLYIISGVPLISAPDKAIDSMKSQISEENLKILEESGFFTAPVFRMVGICILIFSIFVLIVSVSLWKFKKWARITVIVLSGLVFLLTLINLFLTFQVTGILDLIISAAVFYLFALNKKIIRLFKKS